MQDCFAEEIFVIAMNDSVIARDETISPLS